MTLSTAPVTVSVNSALEHYWARVSLTLSEVQRQHSESSSTSFSPAFELPKMSEPLRNFLSASGIALSNLGSYQGKDVLLLDLMRNRNTMTTKTMASLLIVARAVEHIRSTGEKIVIVTPSSGNKVTALRDAVLRALQSGLVRKDELQIVSIVPASSSAKLWSSPLSSWPDLMRRNPVLTYSGPDRSSVKSLAQQAVVNCSDEVFKKCGHRLWYSLDLDNYRVADALRAYFEQDFAPPEPVGRRVHVHSVSSAFGLLGHHLGYKISRPGDPEPHYFLVQQLNTPDMVLDLHYGSADHENIPRYTHDATTGLYWQHETPCFPTVTADPAEILDPTFYTRCPATSSEMSQIIRSSGGGGLVVSLYECLSRYYEIKALLTHSDVSLPSDPRSLREWSLVMAMTGVMNAVDRGLISEAEIVVHGSGSYSTNDFDPIPKELLQEVSDPGDVRAAILCAALGI